MDGGDEKRGRSERERALRTSWIWDRIRELADSLGTMTQQLEHEATRGRSLADASVMETCRVSGPGDSGLFGRLWAPEVYSTSTVRTNLAIKTQRNHRD